VIQFAPHPAEIPTSGNSSRPGRGRCYARAWCTDRRIQHSGRVSLDVHWFNEYEPSARSPQAFLPPAARRHKPTNL